MESSWLENKHLQAPSLYKKISKIVFWPSVCTDKRGYSCLLVLPILRSTALTTCSKCLLSCHFFLGISRFGVFSPHKPWGSCREQTDTAQKCFTSLTCSPAKLWSCTNTALICVLYLSNPNIPHTTQKSCCRALHLQSQEKAVPGQNFSYCNMYWQTRVDLAFHC